MGGSGAWKGAPVQRKKHAADALQCRRRPCRPSGRAAPALRKMGHVPLHATLLVRWPARRHRLGQPMATVATAQAGAGRTGQWLRRKTRQNQRRGKPVSAIEIRAAGAGCTCAGGTFYLTSDLVWKGHVCLQTQRPTFQRRLCALPAAGHPPGLFACKRALAPAPQTRACRPGLTLPPWQGVP